MSSAPVLHTATARPRRRAEIRRVARELLGYDRLRPGQEEAIEAVLNGRDTLAVMATGQGKSAIYQVAGLQLEGLTVVVSPLLALQNDQVNAIEGSSLPARAAALNSNASASETAEVFDLLASGELEFLFVAPEQFANEAVLGRIAAAEPSLFVVDEAHCVSDWGHDFRPAYLRLKPVIEALGGPTILALTATASPPIRAEIVDRLGMEDAAVIVRGFDRPNIHLAVHHVVEDTEKTAAVLEAASAHAGSGIVYVATRRNAEDVAARLAQAGESALAYHAGLTRRQRERAEAAFMANEARIMVATVAFGMGIDKPDIRFVLHHDISGSLDEYYQEIGRAGRDGEPADAVLFYRSEDLGLRKFFGHVPVLEPREIRAVLRLASSTGGAAALERRFPASRVRAASNLLTAAGFTEFGADGSILPIPPELHDDAVEAALAAQERRTQFERSRIEMLRGYAESRGCRRDYLLTYFGDTCGTCANCDCCEGRCGEPETAEPAVPGFEPGARVRHESFGAGQVIRAAEGKLTVLFESAGYRVLGVDLVLQGGLLDRL